MKIFFASVALVIGVAAAGAEQAIDLATTLRLANAQSIDVQIARERLVEARANLDTTAWQFFPWISPGVSYRRHDNLIQDVSGSVIDVHKESYALGPTIVGSLDLGDAIYKHLAARQLVKAADHAVASQQQETTLAAAQGYFDLLKAHTAMGIASEAVRISTNYLAQVERAVEAGIAFRGDALRVEVQAERNQITLRQAEEQKRTASARLTQLLRLDAAIELEPNGAELVRLDLGMTNRPLASLVAQALSTRPELKQSRASLEAARELKKGAVYGPIVPSLGAQVFAGGLGGGKDGAGQVFGESEDFQVTLGWRIGPGGLFDRSRIRATESRVRVLDLTMEKLRDEITREVIEAQNRAQSLAEQIAMATRAAKAAEQTYQLSEQRKQFAVGDVLETIVAEQELTRARLEVANAISEYNKAQYALLRAIGGEQIK
jgi:outer membrane protein TolC